MTELSPAAQVVLNAAHDGANQVLFDIGDDSPVPSCSPPPCVLLRTKLHPLG
jgi:hypothetical protein